jgi:ribosomal protein L12E/L44/L45/RPP1/RPP2
MSNDIFEREVEMATQGGQSAPERVDDLAPEMQEQLRQIESLAQMDPSFANSQEYKDLMAAIDNSRQADEEEEEEEEEYYEEDEEEEEDDDDVFGLTKEEKAQKEIKLNFEPPKEMLAFLNSRYGVKEAEKFFSSVDIWRKQAQEGAEVERMYDALSQDLQAMPAEIKIAVQKWANGEDYMSAFEMNQRLDFSTSWDNQDVEGLVQHYLSEEYDELVSKLDEGDIDEDEFEDRMVLLARSTKRMFTEDKKALDEEREQLLDRQKNEFQTMKKTALLSVENLSKAYPNFSKSEVSKIRAILVEGKVDDLFVNPDGSYKEDAAELVAYAMYGKKMLEGVKKIAQRKGETEANLKAVDSSPKTVRKSRSASSPSGVNIDAVKHLSGVFKGDPYA